MVILLIDTAARGVRAGLAEGTRVIAEEAWDADTRLSETLAERLCTLLEAHRWRFSDVERIRVHAGPGGFTTLRIGVVTANALGYALGVPVEGIVGPLTSFKDLLERPAASVGSGVTTEIGRIPVIPVYDRPPHITTRGRQ